MQSSELPLHKYSALYSQRAVAAVGVALAAVAIAGVALAALTASFAAASLWLPLLRLPLWLRLDHALAASTW